ncbi:replication-relaxation family protein [Streptacidiphilus jiangxiensis]|uniref:Replication-relaxation n=1 Tax=Streptacidiphilus jiangxiensis TaxID=235985 RepID=A0A1H8ANS4_STRJI|nr:replication-relaxation family protein [Streptacidiphilus jiangxiensis]SEM72375.1 Replication-relaxation [Streptacidiphilus jiangxiensis]
MNAATLKRPATMPALSQSAMQVLYQHRLMTTGQLHRLLLPEARRPVYLLHELKRLEDGGLVERVRSLHRNPRHAQFLWFLTEEGYTHMDGSEESVTRQHRTTTAIAIGPRQAHTVAVNEVGIAMFQHARRLGHECGPLDWMPEVAHRMRDGQRRFEDDHVISDAVLDYTHVSADGRRTVLRAFVELDRCTMTVSRLADKVAAYGRYFDYIPQEHERSRRPSSTRPAWQQTYSRFPKLLIVLDHHSQRVMGSRTNDLGAMTSANPRLSSLAGELSIGVTTLDRLRESGPFAPIFKPLLRHQQPTDMFLRPPAGS